MTLLLFETNITGGYLNYIHKNDESERDLFVDLFDYILFLNNRHLCGHPIQSQHISSPVRSHRLYAYIIRF